MAELDPPKRGVTDSDRPFQSLGKANSRKAQCGWMARREPGDVLVEEQVISRSTHYGLVTVQKVEHSKGHSRLAQGENWAYS